MKSPAFIPVGILVLALVWPLEGCTQAADSTLKRAEVPDGELEYEVHGVGEPVLLIHGSFIAGAFLPLMNEPALSDYRLVRYHRRGFADSAELEGPFTIEQQAADARAVLRHLGIRRTHVVGHSYGAVIALQLALDAPEVVSSLALLEPPLMHLVSDFDAPPPSIDPAVEAYLRGDTLGAIEAFGELIGGSEWRSEVDRTVPGGAQQAAADVWTFFEVELPALAQWSLDADRAAEVPRPVLFVRGAESGSHYERVGDLVHSWFPEVERRVVPGVDHLMQMREPSRVAHLISDFLARHPL